MKNSLSDYLQCGKICEQARDAGWKAKAEIKDGVAHVTFQHPVTGNTVVATGLTKAEALTGACTQLKPLL